MIFTLYLVAGTKEVRALPGVSEQNDVYRVASAVNAAIQEVRQARVTGEAGRT